MSAASRRAEGCGCMSTMQVVGAEMDGVAAISPGPAAQVRSCVLECTRTSAMQALRPPACVLESSQTQLPHFDDQCVPPVQARHTPIRSRISPRHRVRAVRIDDSGVGPTFRALGPPIRALPGRPSARQVRQYAAQGLLRGVKSSCSRLSQPFFEISTGT